MLFKMAPWRHCALQIAPGRFSRVSGNRIETDKPFGSRLIIRKPGRDYLLLTIDYLKSFVFSKIMWIIGGPMVNYLEEHVPYFRQDSLRIFEIVDYLHYLILFEIFENCLWIICFGFFVDYLKHGLFDVICLLFICGLFET